MREVVSLVGAEILGDKQRCVFEATKMLKEYFLLQNAFHPVDMYCPIEKTYQMLRLILKFYERAKLAVDSAMPLAQVLSLDVREDLARIKIVRPVEFDKVSLEINKKIDEQFAHLIEETKEDESA